MATKKRSTYIDMELEWLEEKAQELKLYCDNNKIDTLTERMVGNKVVETIGQQIKTIRDTLQDYIKIVEAIDKLREKETSKKQETRGDKALSPLESGEI